jgi:hypothetical protein
MVPIERRSEIVESATWLIEPAFSVFGRDFERTLRGYFPEYVGLEAMAREAGVEAKPFVARWVAERLSVEGDAEGLLHMKQLIVAVRTWSGLAA